MTRTFRRVSLATGMMLAAGIGYAADQTILGRVLTVKAGNNPSQRKVVGVGSEKNSPNTLVGSPVALGSAGGAILELIALGANPSAQTFNLPQGTGANGKTFWSQTGNLTFKYKDPRGEQGPVKGVIVKRTLGGTFTIKAIVSGRNGPVDIVPPDPGVSGCMALKIGISPTVGDRYSVQFGPEGKVKNAGARVFQVRRPTVQAVCPTGLPTTTTTTSIATTTSSSTSTSTSTTSTPVTTTTTTTLYGSPSRAFLAPAGDLLD